ncbi:MAG TPA: hypothetical protein VGB98_23130 [Pyrinomonadaceae bacterium]|jgi:hypothetical protein
MDNLNSLEFFRTALELCVKWGRSPMLARVESGRRLTLRQVMLQLSEGNVPPAITPAEARTLAVEFPFTYTEILKGLSARSASGRATRTTGRRGRGQLATQTA